MALQCRGVTDAAQPVKTHVRVPHIQICQETLIYTNKPSTQCVPTGLLQPYTVTSGGQLFYQYTHQIKKQ